MPVHPDVARFLATHHCDERAEVLADIAELRGLSQQERVAAVVAMGRTTARLLAASPFAQRFLAHREQPHPSYLELVARYRREAAGGQ